MDSGQLIGDHVNLFYPLRDAAAYPGSPFVDMVLYVRPAAEPRSLRLWLKTDAPSPEVELCERRFSPEGRHGGWVDFGCFVEDAESLGVPGFGIIRFYGVSAELARDSWCVITSQTEVEATGSLAVLEQELLGLSRDQAGSSTLSPSRVPVGSAQTFELTYRAGDRGLPPGAVLRMAFPLAFSRPQAEVPDAPGWIECLGGAEAELLSIDGSLESHERVDVFYRLPQGLPSGGVLRFGYRTDFVYLFPMCWSRMERRYWWSHLPVMAPAVSVDDRRIFVAPLEENGHHLLVEPGPVERLHLFLPGRPPSGSGLVLAGVFTDHYRNVPLRSVIDADIELRLCGPETLELGSAQGHFTDWHRFRLPIPDLRPGVYRAEAIRSGTGVVLATSNPLQILPEEDLRGPVYWGEIHGHSEQSDGSGPYGGIFSHAREVGCLAFAAAADHACYLTDNEWQWMQDLVNSRNEEGRFVTLPGYEWAGKQGHRNVYTWHDRLELFRGMYPGTRELKSVYDHFDGNEDVVAGPHVQHTSEFFDGHNPNVQRFMEVTSMWGVYDQLAFKALNGGARIGFTGGGDCHEGRVGFSVEDPDGQGTVPHTFAPGLRYKCGMTGAHLPRLGRHELIHALRERRTYATTGPRILLDFSVSGIPMGGEGDPGGAAPRIEGEIHACGSIRAVQVIRDGTVVHETAPGAGTLDATLAWEDFSCGGGRHWYVLKVIEAGGDMAWSSPVWVEAGAPGDSL